jgi:hypothetical protein
MNLPAFKFINDNLVELPKQEFRAELIEFIQEPFKLQYAERKLSPRLRRCYARKGRPRRQAKRVSAWTTAPVFSPISLKRGIVWVRHTIAIDEQVQDLFRFYATTNRLHPICFVYLPKGIDVDDRVLSRVMKWHCEKRA